MSDITPRFVAHRGFPALYPENSLVGIQAAIQAGACYVEVDIQLSYQLTPYLCHDDDLHRLTGRNTYLTKLRDDEIDTLVILYPDSKNLRNPTKSAPIPRLSEFCHYLVQYPQVTAFIEIKPESISRFGLNETVATILPIIHPIREQCVLISFNWKLMALIRTYQIYRIGWIIEHWTDEQFAMALYLQPDYLFSSIRRFPEKLDNLWRGPWEWVIYTVDNYNTALEYAKAGITLIETDAIGTLLQY